MVAGDHAVAHVLRVAGVGEQAVADRGSVHLADGGAVAQGEGGGVRHRLAGQAARGHDARRRHRRAVGGEAAPGDEAVGEPRHHQRAVRDLVGRHHLVVVVRVDSEGAVRHAVGELAPGAHVAHAEYVVAAHAPPLPHPQHRGGEVEHEARVVVLLEVAHHLGDAGAHLFLRA